MCKVLFVRNMFYYLQPFKSNSINIKSIFKIQLKLNSIQTKLIFNCIEMFEVWNFFIELLGQTVCKRILRQVLIVFTEWKIWLLNCCSLDARQT